VRGAEAPEEIGSHDDPKRDPSGHPYGQKIHLRRPAPSRRFTMVITQEPTQSLAALNRPRATNIRVPREQQNIALSLMIPLRMEVFGIFAQRVSQGALAKEYNFGGHEIRPNHMKLRLHGSDKMRNAMFRILPPQPRSRVWASRN